MVGIYFQMLGLMLVEQVFVFFVVEWFVGIWVYLLVQGIGVLGGWVCSDGFVLVFEVGECGEVYWQCVVGVDLGVIGYVGDGVFVVGQEGMFGQVFVYYFVQVVYFVVIVFDCIWDFFWGIYIEMFYLVVYWFQVGYLLEQLFQGGDVVVWVGGQEVVGFFGQVQQDCIGFEYVLWGIVIGWGVVDDGWYFVVG